tara:strand:- start:270 stop:635 length:366 start_codon:yes stop_codon:yes gene_type:complete
MTLQTFPSTPQPSYPVRKRSSANQRTVRFADGYEHTILFGVAAHQNPKEFSLIWKNITEAEADSIESFLDDRILDNKPFIYQPPNESSSMVFRCSEWNKDMNVATLATITATFRQVFEPTT